MPGNPPKHSNPSTQFKQFGKNLTLGKNGVVAEDSQPPCRIAGILVRQSGRLVAAEKSAFSLQSDLILSEFVALSLFRVGANIDFRGQLG